MADLNDAPAGDQGALEEGLSGVDLEGMGELIVRMKDTASLMHDLAYSALLYQDRKIAREVLHLEAMMDELLQTTHQQALLAIHDQASGQRALAMVHLAGCFDRISEASRRIAEVVLRDIAPHPVLAVSIEDSEAIFARARIRSASPLVGKSLGKVGLASESGMWVVAIRRDERWIFGPDEDQRLRSGDLLLARGPAEGLEHFHGLARGETELVG